MRRKKKRWHAIRVDDPWFRRIDVSVFGFLAQEDVVPIELPPQLALPEAAAPRGETASLCLSFDEEIDQFQLEEEREEQRDLVIHISDLEDEFDRISGVRTLGFILVKVEDSSEEEKEKMALNSRKGLKDSSWGRIKGHFLRRPRSSSPLLLFPLLLLAFSPYPI